MKRLLNTMLLVLAGLAVMAQTNQPLPGDAVPLTNTIYLSPSDSTVWAADPFGVSVKLGDWFKVDSLNKTRQKAFALDVTDFGAVGDSSTINTGAFYDAFDFAVANGFKHIYVPSGTYLVDSMLVLPKDISIFGDGYSSCLIPVGDSTDYVPSGTGSSVFIYNSGTEQQLGNVTSAISKGDDFIKNSDFASEFKTGDVIKIVDTANFSFSGYRPEDKNGEYFTVYRISADTIFLDHPFSDDYQNTSETIVFKPDLSVSSLSDIRIGHSAASPMVQRILFEDIGNTRFSNVHVTGARHWNIRITGGYNIALDRIYSQQNLQPSGGLTQYALMMGGVQNFIVTNSELFGVRHGLTIANVIWGHEVLARFGTIYNCRLFSREQYGADTHGASSNITFDNNIITGIQLRGRSHYITNNTINPFPRGEQSEVIKFTELKQIDFTVTGNRVFSRGTFVQIEPMARYSGFPSTTYQLDAGGTFKMTDNVMSGMTTDSTTFSDATFNIHYTRNLGKNLGVNFEISNNTIVTRNRVPQTLRITGNSGYRIGNAMITNNHIIGGIISIRYAGNSTVSGNQFDECPWNAIAVLDSDTANIVGNIANSIVREESSPSTNRAFAIVFDVSSASIIGNSVLNMGLATKSFEMRNISNAVLGTNYFGGLSPVFSNVPNRNYPSARQLNIDGLNAVPASATATGTTGEIRVTADFIYICVGTNQWKRVAISAW